MNAETGGLEKGNGFLRTLATETAWEWRWEKHNRMLSNGINWATWISRLLILAFAWFEWTGGEKTPPPSWLLFVLAVLAVLNVALPLLTYTFKFQQRQEVHDTNAREFECITVAYEAGQIDLGTAVLRFTEKRRQSPEIVVRGMP